MRFLMLVCRDESIEFSPEDGGDVGSQVQAWVSEMEQRGVRLQGDVLAAVDATRNVRVRAGEIEVDDGPRVEMTAPPSGFNLLECADIDEAIEVSAKHPIARYGVIELRPIIEG
ncbi:MAG TPA: YciI family protein [Solirubrobacteraceae bacterium]